MRAAGNAEQTVTTDAGGVAVVAISAGAAGWRRCDVEASDRGGQPRVERACRWNRAAGGDQILLRTERAVYRAGERIALQVFSTKDAGHGVCRCGEGRADRADARSGSRERRRRN